MILIETSLPKQALPVALRSLSCSLNVLCGYHFLLSNMAKDKDASKDAAKAAKKAAKKAMDERENERRTRVKAALFLDGGAPRNALEGLAAFTKFERNGIEADIFQTSVEEPSWTPELETFIFDLTKQNSEFLSPHSRPCPVFLMRAIP